MMLEADSLATEEELTERVPERGGVAGIPFHTIAVEGVLHLDDLDEEHVLVLQKDEDGTHLTVIPKKTLMR